ncbi:MAG: S8 family serine peptidase [Thermoleophilia bacterium]
MATLAACAVVSPSALAVPSEVLVRVAPGAGAAGEREIDRALEATEVRELPAGWRAYTLPEGKDLADARKDLAATDADLRLDPSPTIRALATDPGTAWHLVRIGAQAAWSSSRAPVTVAVSDTGVDLGHPFLASQAWRNPREIKNGIDDDGNRLVDDVSGWDFLNGDATVYDSATGDSHGTHVASTIAGINAPAAALGVAPNARIMVVKFMAGGKTTTTAAAIASLDYASRSGARVINVSWGTPTYSQALCDAVAVAVSRGSLIVAAAGNDGADESAEVIYPAGCPSSGIVSVAATDQNDRLASFSNRGATTVDMAAPGVDIVAGLPGGAFGSKSGTSMAAPQVVGAAALMLGNDPSLTPMQVRARLLNEGVSLPDLAGTTTSGKRLLIPPAFVTAPTVSKPADSTAPPASLPRPRFSVTHPTDGAYVRELALHWTSPSPATAVEGFRVLVDEGEIGRVPGDEFRFDSSVVPEGPHFVRVAGDLADGRVASTTPIAVFVDRTEPTPPTIVPITHPRDRTVRVTWTPASDDGGIDHYVVRWATGALQLPADRLAMPFDLDVHRATVVSVTAVDTAGNERTARRALNGKRMASDPGGLMLTAVKEQYGVCRFDTPSCPALP